MAFEGGPYVKAAVFCDRVIEGKDNVLSFIRVIDRLVTVASGPGAPNEMPPSSFQMTAVIMFTSGMARGRHDVRLEREAPNGTRNSIYSASVHLEGENKGHNLILNLAERFDFEGIYWYDVFVENQLMTRMPFQVIYSRQSAGRPPAS
jgi:hypothetical protein